jgi:hypothetical protein
MEDGEGVPKRGAHRDLPPRLQRSGPPGVRGAGGSYLSRMKPHGPAAGRAPRTIRPAPAPRVR